MSSEIKSMIKDITKILLALLSIGSALNFVGGFRTNSSSLYASLFFCITWLVFDAITEELELEGKNLLTSLGISAPLATLLIVVLLLNFVA